MGSSRDGSVGIRSLVGSAANADRGPRDGHGDGAVLVFVARLLVTPACAGCSGSTIVGSIGGVPTAGIAAWLARRSSWTRAITSRRNVAVVATSPTNGPVPSGDVPAPTAGESEPGQRRWVAWLAVLGAAVLIGRHARRSRSADPGSTPDRSPPARTPALATLRSRGLVVSGIARAAGHTSFREMCGIAGRQHGEPPARDRWSLGFRSRMYLFARRGIPAGSAVLSLLQTLLTNLVLLLFVMWGFALLLLSHNLVGRELVAAGGLLIAFALVVIVTCVALLRRKWRRGLLFSAHDSSTACCGGWRHHRPQRSLIASSNLNVGLDFLRAARHAVADLIVLDWIFTLLVLYSAFLASAHPLR